MASSKVFKRVSLTLMLCLASMSSLTRSEPNLHVNTRTTNTTDWGNPFPTQDPRHPRFISNVLRGLDGVRSIVGHTVPLVEIVTNPRGGNPSSCVGDFTSIRLLVHLESTAEVAGLFSRERWGSWYSYFSYRRPFLPEQDKIIPLWVLEDYDQWEAFSVVPALSGPWNFVSLRMGALVAHHSVPIWFFGNIMSDICTFALRNPDSSWYVHSTPMSTCGSNRLPANVSVPQTFLLDDANNNVSSSSYLPLPTAGTDAPEVALTIQNHDGFNETNGRFEQIATR